MDLHLLYEFSASIVENGEEELIHFEFDDLPELEEMSDLEMEMEMDEIEPIIRVQEILPGWTQSAKYEIIKFFKTLEYKLENKLVNALSTFCPMLRLYSVQMLISLKACFPLFQAVLFCFLALNALLANGFLIVWFFMNNGNPNKPLRFECLADPRTIILIGILDLFVIFALIRVIDRYRHTIGVYFNHTLDYFMEYNKEARLQLLNKMQAEMFTETERKLLDYQYSDIIAE